MIELMYLKELILIKQLNKKDLLLGTIDKGRAQVSARCLQ